MFSVIFVEKVELGFCLARLDGFFFIFYWVRSCEMQYFINYYILLDTGD
jgi:hypothetical protein